MLLSPTPLSGGDQGTRALLASTSAASRDRP